MAVITATDLTQTDPLKTVSPSNDTTDYGGIVKNAIASIPTAQSAVDAAHANDVANVNKIQTDQNTILGKTADTQAANETYGVNLEKDNLDKYNQQLNDINANISGLANEAKAIPLKVQQANQNTGATDAGVAPQTTGQLRENAIKALTQSSLADVLTANINNSTIRYNAAKDKAQQAIDLKYKPLEDEVSNLKDQLDLNKKYITDPAEKKLADAQNIALNERERVLAQQKSDETAVTNMKLEAVKNFGAKVPADVLKNLDGKSPADALSVLAPYLKTNTNEITKLADGSTVVIDKQTGRVISNLGGGTNPNVVLPATIVQTVQTPTGAKAVSGYALKAGDDPYQVAITNGTDMATLKQLNPNITDWTKLPVGAVINLPNTTDTWLNGKTPAQISAYNSLPDADKASVKQLVNGDVLITDLVKSRGITSQAAITKLINQASAIDPNFSVNENKQRYTYKTQFNNPNGKEQVQINAINTGLGHLGEFKVSADALGNTIALPYNKLVNYLKKNTGDPKVTKLNTVITALAGELASVYKNGTAPTDQETEEWRNTILASFSDAQTAGVAASTANLISNKLQSLNNSYKNVMGAYPDSSIINPDVIQQLQDAGVDVSGITSKLKAQGYSVPEQASNDNFLSQFSGASANKNLSNSDFFNLFKL